MKNKNLFIKAYCIITTMLSMFIVIYLLGFIIYKGGKNISLEFIRQQPKGMPLGSSGGIFPAIIGSLYFTIVAIITAVILAFSISVYIIFYLRNEKIKGILRVIIGVIAGIPSVVLGLFGYTFFVVKLGFGISILSGGLVLGIMVFPYIEIKLEKTFIEIDKSLITASYSLGVNKFYTLINLIIPMTSKEILSTLAIGASFAIGAAAPILLTGAVMYAKTPRNIFSPAMALPVHLYYLINEGISKQNAYATAFLMIIILFILNGIPYIFSFMKGDK